jgi:hypothetical protein
MACPQVADGGDGLQIWRVTGNILKKQSRIATSGWSSSLQHGRDADNSLPLKKIVIKYYTRPRTWTDSLERRKQMRSNIRLVLYGLASSGSGYGLVAGSCEHGNELSCSIEFWEIHE